MPEIQFSPERKARRAALDASMDQAALRSLGMMIYKADWTESDLVEVVAQLTYEPISIVNALLSLEKLGVISVEGTRVKKLQGAERKILSLRKDILVASRPYWREEDTREFNSGPASRQSASE